MLEIYPKRLQESAVLSRAMLAVFGVAFAAAAAYRAMRCCEAMIAPQPLILLGGGVAVALASLVAASLLHGTVIRRFLREGLMVGCALLTAEIAVNAAMPWSGTIDTSVRDALIRFQAARRLGEPFDTRSVRQVIRDLERDGIEAVPGIGRRWPSEPAAAAQLEPGFFPLSQISGAHVVECNETGEYLVFETDEFGFNNPPGLIASKRIDVAVVGDSLALGHCVPPGESTVDLIRARFPRTANFALADTRSLVQLASHREYVEPLRPPVVLWFVSQYYATLNDERDNEDLLRYLDPSFSQGLIARQREVDDAYRDVALPLLAAAGRAHELEMQSARRWLGRVYKLPMMRNGLSLFAPGGGSPPEPDLTLFEIALTSARDSVRGWGGKVIVVLLPHYEEAVSREGVSPTQRRIVAIASALGVPVINGALPFIESDDPAGLFGLRVRSHPTKEGHAMLADLIIAELAREPALRAQPVGEE